MDAEFEHEPIPGLPARLPQGEDLLWQGSPHWRSVATRVLHVRFVGAYFAILVLWRALSGWYEGQSLVQVARGCAMLSVLGAMTLLFLLWVARRIARSTVYSISSRRIVMRFGIALPIALNIPFRKVHAASLREYGDGTGDIPISLADGEHLAYLHLWPHARPWRLAHAEPMLRGVPGAAEAARILGGALAT
ncbi:MAG: PH domain-containing protein [Proteobacteria bacterium]|nr:PH domain-containing protein [Pseudomonadota bacterium]